MNQRELTIRREVETLATQCIIPALAVLKIEQDEQAIAGPQTFDHDRAATIASRMAIRIRAEVGRAFVGILASEDADAYLERVAEQILREPRTC